MVGGLSMVGGLGGRKSVLAPTSTRRYTPRLVRAPGLKWACPAATTIPLISLGMVTERRPNAQDEDQIVGQEAVQDHRDRQGARRAWHEAPWPDQPLAEDEAHQSGQPDADRDGREDHQAMG